MEKTEETTRFVREKYGHIAEQGGDCCSSSCCQGDDAGTPRSKTARLGYRDTDLAAVPQRANLGLGCGNPHQIAELQEGETVLDLGSGGGLDCFLAARQVGSRGHVIGVDMTAEMVSLAHQNLNDSDAHHVEFRLGEIEHLPVADRCIDVIMSNCVINLSPDKAAVFTEAMRVLKPGGRLAISDVVATAPLPQSRRQDLRAVASCLGGAATVSEITGLTGTSVGGSFRSHATPSSTITGPGPRPGASSRLWNATLHPMPLRYPRCTTRAASSPAACGPLWIICQTPMRKRSG